MYNSNNGCMALRLETGELYLFVPECQFQYFDRKAANEKLYEVTDDEDAPEQECINYVMGHPGSFHNCVQLTPPGEFPVLLEDERYTWALYQNGEFYLSPLNARNWVDVSQTRELENSIKRKLGEYKRRVNKTTAVFSGE